MGRCGDLEASVSTSQGALPVPKEVTSTRKFQINYLKDTYEAGPFLTVGMPLGRGGVV